MLRRIIEKPCSCRFQRSAISCSIGPPQYPGETEITPAMVESVRQRIKDAGGILTVWAVLNEDVYETQFGDGFYLHVHGLALNSEDAQRLAALGGGD